MKGRFLTILLELIFMAGLCLLLYPSASHYWNAVHSSRAADSYYEVAGTIDEDLFHSLWDAADRYNEELLHKDNRWFLNDDERSVYQETLRIGEDDTFGVIEIPKIRVTLPIMHGTSDYVLRNGAGHFEGSSLPVGGPTTHSVLTGHRGLPSARLFTDLNRLIPGDVFYLNILGEILSYEVDQVLTVDPDDLTALAIEDGKDLCTLVTCTPYGINTHRMLVRGHRIQNADASRTVRVTSDAEYIEPRIVAPIFGSVIVLLLLVGMILSPIAKHLWKRVTHDRKRTRT